MPSSKRPIRVAGASGGYTDRQRAIHDLAKECEVDVITGGKLSRGEELYRPPKRQLSFTNVKTSR